MTETADVLDGPPVEPARGRGPHPESQTPIVLGLALAAAGLLVIAFGWVRVAGMAAVALQLPIVLSAGFTGLGLVILGVFVVAVWSQRQAAYERQQQLAELAAALADLAQREQS
jgi:hypothetical protein